MIEKNEIMKIYVYICMRLDCPLQRGWGGVGDMIPPLPLLVRYCTQNRLGFKFCTLHCVLAYFLCVCGKIFRQKCKLSSPLFMQ